MFIPHRHHWIFLLFLIELESILLFDHISLNLCLQLENHSFICLRIRVRLSSLSHFLCRSVSCTVDDLNPSSSVTNLEIYLSLSLGDSGCSCIIIVVPSGPLLHIHLGLDLFINALPVLLQIHYLHHILYRLDPLLLKSPLPINGPVVPHTSHLFLLV